MVKINEGHKIQKIWSDPL